MRFNVACVLFFLGMVPNVRAQSIRIATGSGYIVAHVVDVSSRRQVHTDRNYHWVRAQTLTITQGGIGGPALHGSFISYFPEGQLQEQGSFRHGLKEGEWRTWGVSGRLTIQEHWNKGRLHGRVLQFGDGKVVSHRVLHYRNGRLIEKRSDTLSTQAIHNNTRVTMTDSSSVVHEALKVSSGKINRSFAERMKRLFQHDEIGTLKKETVVRVKRKPIPQTEDSKKHRGK